MNLSQCKVFDRLERTCERRRQQMQDIRQKIGHEIESYQELAGKVLHASGSLSDKEKTLKKLIDNVFWAGIKFDQEH